MSSSLVGSLAVVLTLPNNDMWDKADNVTQKVSDLAEAIAYSGLDDDVRTQLLIQLNSLKALYDVVQPKQGNVAEGEVAQAEPAKPKHTPMNMLRIDTTALGGVVFYNDEKRTQEFVDHATFSPLAVAYSLRKLNFDIKQLEHTHSNATVRELLQQLHTLGANIITDNRTMMAGL